MPRSTQEIEDKLRDAAIRTKEVNKVAADIRETRSLPEQAALSPDLGNTVPGVSIQAQPERRN